MKTIKYIGIFCLTMLFLSCGKSTKDLVATQWTTINGGISARAGSWQVPLEHFKGNDEAFIAFQKKLIEILKSRVFDLKEDGTFTMTSPGNAEIKGTWEYNLGSDIEYIDFTVNGKLFETWKADLCGGDDCGFHRLTPKSNYMDKHVNIFARYNNEEFKEIMGESTFSVELNISPKNTEGFDIR